jgi:FAD/FMN-containing dehydrogenase
MTSLVEAMLRRLGERLQDRVSVPGDDRYMAATAIWAKPVGQLPRAVVHCRTPQDVQWAIQVARDCGVALSVRGGGHDWAGRALCDGIVVDLSNMKAVSVDPSNHTAKISGGARAVDVLAATTPFGLAAVTGSVGAVGMAGLTLGGGYGPLIGRFGLALDNLFAAEVVLADGRIVIADDAHEADLLWALRGGGGNFGVVTTMRLRLHQLPSVHFGMLIYPFAEAEMVFQCCADIAAQAPEELTVQVGSVAGPDGARVVMVLPTWCGPPREGEGRIAPFLKLGTRLGGEAETMPYERSLSAFDAFLANGQRTFMETCWLPELNRDGIDVFIQTAESAVSPGCAIFTHEFKGAATRVAADATAFGQRGDHVLVEILAAYIDRSNKIEEQRHRQWASTARHAFDAAALPGGYPNLLASSDTDRAAKSYGPNFKRLVKVKQHYDSDNVFRSAIPLPASVTLADFA